jgi:hypothetical protein
MDQGMKNSLDDQHPSVKWYRECLQQVNPRITVCQSGGLSPALDGASASMQTFIRPQDWLTSGETV